MNTGIRVPTFLSAKMQLSVAMNGLLIPFNRSLVNLQRFCRPTAIHNDDPIYDLSFAGSCFLFRYCGRNLLLCSRHQLANTGRSPEEMVVILESDEGRIALSPSEVVQILGFESTSKDVGDIVLAEYRSEQRGAQLSPHFYNLDIEGAADLRRVPKDNVQVIFTVGYPSRFTDYDTVISEAGDITGANLVSRWAKIYLQQTPTLGIDREGLVPFEVHEDYQIDLGDPDGFSGAPVFFVYLDETRIARLGFGGMVTYASALGRFNVIEASYIRAAVRSMITS